MSSATGFFGMIECRVLSVLQIKAKYFHSMFTRLIRCVTNGYLPQALAGGATPTLKKQHLVSTTEKRHDHILTFALLQAVLQTQNGWNCIATSSFFIQCYAQASVCVDAFRCVSNRLSLESEEFQGFRCESSSCLSILNPRTDVNSKVLWQCSQP